MSDDLPKSKTSCRLLYDGDCPMCATFANTVNKRAAGSLEKINARDITKLRSQATAAGMDLDYGVVVENQGQLYFGADALYYLAHRNHQDWVLKLIYMPFRSRTFAKCVYPILVRVRWLLLWLARKSPIDNLSKDI